MPLEIEQTPDDVASTVIETPKPLVDVAAGTYVCVIIPVLLLVVNETVCVAFPKVTETADDVAVEYLVSEAIVAVIEHVPLDDAVSVGVVEVVLLNVQPVAVPLVTAKVFAPVPDDPEVESVNACE